MRVIIIALILLLSNNIYANSSGSELLRQCQNSIKHIEDDYKDLDLFYSGYCLGLLNGFAKAYQQSHIFYELGAEKKLPCVPAEATGDQLIRILVKYLKDKPERLHEPYGPLVYSALAGAFACN